MMRAVCRTCDHSEKAVEQVVEVVLATGAGTAVGEHPTQLDPTRPLGYECTFHGDGVASGVNQPRAVRVPGEVVRGMAPLTPAVPPEQQNGCDESPTTCESKSSSIALSRPSQDSNPT